MAELLVAVVAKLVDLAVEEARQQVSKVASLDDELRKLESGLRSIQPFLEDAHNKQFSLHSAIRDWIAQVSDMLYDAEDVIDLYRAKIKLPRNKPKVRKMLSSLLPVWCRDRQFVFQTESKLRKVIQRLTELYSQRNDLGLRPIEGATNKWNYDENRDTTSSDFSQHVFGREKDEEQVLGWLIDEVADKTRRKRITSNVVAIIGMGGLGKTTLAKKIYNNPNLKSSFDMFMWICTSEKPQKIDLFRKMLEVVAGKESGADKLRSMEALSLEIRKRIEGKKYFLVLDDVWDFGHWKDELEGVLTVGSVESRVLLTTRKMDVVKGFDAMDRCHELGGLSHVQSWNLFKAKVLRSDETEQVFDEIKDIAEVIVGKCQGVPLALSVVGSLLRNKERNMVTWKGIAESSLWDWKDIMDDHNQIVGAIALSYMDLSFPLKRCLAYCCIFPKDYPMSKRDLVELWIAEGFINSDKGELEELAGCYLQTLVNCSLIQNAGQSGNYLYTLHDIVHDFTLGIQGGKHANAASPTVEISSFQDRFLCSMGSDLSCIRRASVAHEKVRTILVLNQSPTGDSCLHHGITSKFRHLRVLDLSLAFKLSKLPEDLGSLVLLRYINVSRTSIKNLPESICELGNLQMLDISYTQIETFPEGISRLASLRHLYLDHTANLKCLPRKIGQLTCLRTLSKYIIGSEETTKKSGSSINQLGHLKHLSGKLRIQHIERIGGRDEAKEAELHKKINLTELELSCDCEWNKLSPNIAQSMEGVYQELQPPKSLRVLKINNYCGTVFPGWICSIAKYRSLEKVELNGCICLEELPPFGSLPCLARLKISSCATVKTIGAKFYYTETASRQTAVFPRLEELEISEMDNLEDWCSFSIQGSVIMPQLRSFKIEKCPKLKVLPNHGLPVDNLTELKMVNLPEIESIPSFLSLKKLEELVLVGMPNLNSQVQELLQGLNEALAMKRLELCGFLEVELEPETMEEAMEVMNLLQVLELTECPKLVSCFGIVLKPHHLPNLRCARIHRCSHLYEYTNFGGPDYVVMEVSVDSDELSSKLSGLGNIGSRVGYLEVILDDEVCCLPEWIQQFHQLLRLSIDGGFSKMTHLPEWLGDFPELWRLKLKDFLELSHLPNSMTSLTKLQQLLIHNCPKLEQRLLDADLCKTLSHIDDIYVRYSDNKYYAKRLKPPPQTEESS